MMGADVLAFDCSKIRGNKEIEAYALLVYGKLS